MKKANNNRKRVVCNEKAWRAGKMAYVGYWSRTVAIEVILSFNFDVVFARRKWKYIDFKTT
jgi:hypothetical protein